MLNNLIESSSHTRELKRRGSFVLLTAATYVLLFSVAGVASIYAYDARLEEQNNNLIVTMLLPPDSASTPQRVLQPPGKTKEYGVRFETTREKAMADLSQAGNVPEKTSGEPNRVLPEARDPFGTKGGDPKDVLMGGPGQGGGGGPGLYSGAKQPVIEVGAPPLPQSPVQKSVPKIIYKGPVTGLALTLPKPSYPSMGLQVKAQGPVNVQVLIDERGKVVSAKALSGHRLLVAAAVQAAYGARFSPTTFAGRAVKVSGVITYNFVLQR